MFPGEPAQKVVESYLIALQQIVDGQIYPGDLQPIAPLLFAANESSRTAFSYCVNSLRRNALHSSEENRIAAATDGDWKGWMLAIRDGVQIRVLAVILRAYGMVPAAGRVIGFSTCLNRLIQLSPNARFQQPQCF